MSKRLEVANYWIKAYEFFTGKKVLMLDAKAKVSLTQKIAGVSGVYGWSNADVIGLIDFAYLHNPLGVDDISIYGNFVNMTKAASAYSRWRRTHGELIEGVGLGKAIFETAPASTNSDLQEQWVELANAYHKQR